MDRIRLLRLVPLRPYERLSSDFYGTRQLLRRNYSAKLNMPSFDALSEVIVYAQDVDQLASFYTDVLGLEIARGDPEHGFVAYDTGDCQLCLHVGGDGDLGASAPKFVFEVDDLEAARSHLQDHDIEPGDIRTPAPGVAVCDGRDPEGNRFSIESSVASE